MPNQAKNIPKQTLSDHGFKVCQTVQNHVRPCQTKWKTYQSKSCQTMGLKSAKPCKTILDQAKLNENIPKQTLPNHGFKVCQTVQNHFRPSQTKWKTYQSKSCQTMGLKSAKPCKNHSRPSQTKWKTYQSKPCQTVQNHSRPRQTLTNTYQT